MYTQPCDGPVEFRRAAREACREGVDMLKIVPPATRRRRRLRRRTTLMTEEEVAAVCEVARERGKRVAAHARSAESVKMCVRNGVESSITRPARTRRRSTCSKRRRTACSSRRAWRSPGRAARGREIRAADIARRSSARIERELAMTCERMKELKRRGVRVLPGGDYGFPWNPHGNNARDLASSSTCSASRRWRRSWPRRARRRADEAAASSAWCARARSPTCCSSTATRWRTSHPAGRGGCSRS